MRRRGRRRGGREGVDADAFNARRQAAGGPRGSCSVGGRLLRAADRVNKIQRPPRVLHLPSGPSVRASSSSSIAPRLGTTQKTSGWERCRRRGRAHGSRGPHRPPLTTPRPT
jgi:hypothetical protein